MSPSSRCGGHPFESPGRGGGRRGPGCSGRERPGPLPAPHQVEESGPQFPQFLYLVQLRGSVSKLPLASPATASVLREHPATLAAQLRGCLVSKSGSPAKLASPTWTPFSQGKAGRARPCLSPGCYSSATLPGQARQRCVGHPECGPWGAAGAACGLRQASAKGASPIAISAPPSTPCAGCTLGAWPSAASVRPSPRRPSPSSPACGHPPHPSRHRPLRIGNAAGCFHSKAGASEREPASPASTPVPRSQGGPSRPGPWGRSFPPARQRSLSGSGSPRSPSPCAAKARSIPTHKDRPQGQPSASLRGLYGFETLCRAPASGPVQLSTRYPAPPSRPRYSKP